MDHDGSDSTPPPLSEVLTDALGAVVEMTGLLHTVLWVVGSWAVFRCLLRFLQLAHYHRYVDRRRRFSRAQHAEIVRRAGYRCEHHSLVFRRCRAGMPLEADHVHPWSKGGQTAVENGQALCSFHNTVKWAWVPSMLSVLRLQHRRMRYFPADASVAVVRRGGFGTRRRRGGSGRPGRR